MFDLAINNGVIIDPVDGEYRGNIGVNSGKIVLISPNLLYGRKTIDAGKMSLSAVLRWSKTAG